MLHQTARGIVVCLSLTLVTALAQEQPGAAPPEALGLPQALDRTLARNPALRAQGFEIAAAEGRLLQSTLRPGASLNVVLEDAFGTGDYAGLSAADTTISIGWILERGRRERIVDASRAAADATAIDIDIAQLDAAAETARRFLDSLLHQEQYRIAETGIALAQEAIAAVERRVEAGLAPAAELARAEAALARAEIRLDHFEHERISAWYRLSAQWGETEPDFARVAGTLAAAAPPEAFTGLLARLESNPDLAAYVSAARVAEAELALARAEARPSWELSGGLRRIEASDDWALVGGVRIPLPFGNRNQGRIAESEARRGQIDAAAAAERIRIETELFVLWQELNHEIELATALDTRVAPKLASALTDLGRAFELGRTSFLELSAVQTELLDVRYEILDAHAAAHRVVIEIERLTGESLAPVSE